MPTFKHPCPACGNLIARDVARCPYCGAVDPFVPGRCPKCRAIIEDPAWLACAKCGTPLREGVAPMPGATPAAAAAPGTVAAPVPSEPPAAAPPSAPVSPLTPTPQSPSGVACSGCGAALAPGASFCTVCGTLAR